MTFPRTHRAFSAAAAALALALLPLGAQGAHPRPTLLSNSLTVVKAINNGPGFRLYALTPVGNKLIFIAGDPYHQELWVSDGTEPGTHLIKDLTAGTKAQLIFNLGTPPLAPEYFPLLGNSLILYARGLPASGISSQAPHNAVIATDGTAEGTVELTSFDGVAPGRVLFKGAVYWIQQNTATGYELWRTDGTVAGTQLVKDINPGSEDGAVGLLEPSTSDLSYIGIVGDVMLFAGNDGATGWNLWRSDGTSAGTFLLKHIDPAGTAGDLRMYCPRIINGRLFFSAANPETGRELWVSDGTEAGTTMLKDIAPGSISSNPCDFTEFNGWVYFRANSATGSIELWRTDGTIPNTALFKNFGSGDLSRYGSGFATTRKNLFFSASDSRGQEPWISDGTVEGTTLLADLAVNTSSYPNWQGSVGDWAYFTASIPAYLSKKKRLWATNGSQVVDISPDGFPPGAVGNTFPSINLNGVAFIALPDDSGGENLWQLIDDKLTRVSNGSPVPGPFQTQSITSVNGTLYYSANDKVNGAVLWKGPTVVPGVQRITINDQNRSDIVLQHTNGQTFACSVDGHSILNGAFLTDLGPALRVQGVGDLLGTGWDGLVMRDETGSNRFVPLEPPTVQASGFKSLPPVTLPAVEPNWELAAVADFDGDGRDDLFWRDGGGANMMLTNYANGDMARSALPDLGSDWKVAGVGDFDGDGKADILWRHDSGTTAISYMRGPTVKQAALLPGQGPDWSVAGVADFNRDGKPDILWRNQNGANVIWIMINTQISRVTEVPSVAPDWRVIGTGDYNGDGFADILWEQTATGDRKIWTLSNGAYQSEALMPNPGDLGWQVINPVSNR